MPIFCGRAVQKTLNASNPQVAALEREVDGGAETVGLAEYTELQEALLRLRTRHEQLKDSVAHTRAAAAGSVEHTAAPLPAASAAPQPIEGHDPSRATARNRELQEVRAWFGRIVASEREVPILFVNLV
jgi:hypothetical protein